MPLPAKFWFKWQRLKAALRESFGTPEATAEPTHRMCPHCRGLIDRDAAVCPLCGDPVRRPRARAASGRILGGLIPVPSTATSALVAAIILLYAVSWYLSLKSAEPGAPVSFLGGIDGEVLLRLGAKAGPLIFAGEWWRLVTAIFLHAGLIHIGFNLWCLFDLGPTVEALFSTSKFIVFYLLAGIVGFVLSLFWSPYGISIGASGSVLGLIGVLIGATFHHGQLGREYRSQLWRWVIYIFVFGLFFRTDNAAHLGGLVCGVALGYFIAEGEPETRAAENLWNGLALLSVLIIAASFVLMALQLNRPLG
jgi:rhomboid protease GluP